MTLVLRPVSQVAGLTPQFRASAVLVPALAPFAPALWPLVAHLPVLDVNGALLAALAAAEPFCRAPPVAAVFACDPFLRIADAAAALRRAGIAQVLNWPSVQAHDGEAAAALAAVGYRAEAEFRVLLGFASHGLEPLAFAAGRGVVDAALALGLRRFVLPAGERWAELASHVAVEGGAALAWSDAALESVPPPLTARGGS